MKLVPKDSEWKKIHKIILNINSAEANFSDFFKINLDCSFENIAKGRCHLNISKKKKNEADTLFVHTDKALMIVNLYYQKKKIDELIEFFSKKRVSSKKIKVILEISESLMINNKGYLYIKDNLKIHVKSITWVVPLI